LYESVYEKTCDKFGDFVVQFGEPKKKLVHVVKEEPLKLELENFIEAVKKDGQPLVSGEDGLSVLRIAIEIIKSCGG